MDHRFWKLDAMINLLYGCDTIFWLCRLLGFYEYLIRNQCLQIGSKDMEVKPEVGKDSSPAPN